MMQIVEVVPQSLAPTAVPTVKPSHDNNDDEDFSRDLHIAVGILAAAVGVLIIAVIYYCIFVAGGSSQPVPRQEVELGAV